MTTKPVPFKAEELVELAGWQKTVPCLLLFGIAGIIAIRVTPYAPIIVGFFQMIFVYKLAASLKQPLAFLYFFYPLIPVVGLLVMLYLSMHASDVLKQNHVRVHWLVGAEKDDLVRLQVQGSAELPPAETTSEENPAPAAQE